jgi:hypothetical protein
LLSSINGEYEMKSLAFKWVPDLKLLVIEKIKGRGRMSFEHVNRPPFKIGLTYFVNVLVGKMIQVTNIAQVQKHDPIIRKPTVQSGTCQMDPFG